MKFRLCESSNVRKLRTLMEDKIQICIKKPQKYEQTLPILNSQVRKPNVKAIQIIITKIKRVMKQDKYQPAQKLRSMILLKDLMQSQNKQLGKYVVKKLLKRLKIFASHRKNQKDQHRGANLFKCKRSQQQYGEEFLKILLLSLQDWGKNWPRNADGPFHQFQATYNQLLMEKQVTFPTQPRKTMKSIAPKHSQNIIQIHPQNQRNAIQNPISRPTMKQKLPLSQFARQYIDGLISKSNDLISILNQNPQFNQVWSVIKDYVQQFKQLDEKGKLIIQQLLDKQQPNQNHQLFQSIQSTSQFISQLIKDTNKIDRKNENYKKYHDKYIKQCKKLIVSLSIYNNNPTPPTSNILKDDNVNTDNKIVNKFQKNRYGSSNQLKNKLQFNTLQFIKEDFNSKNYQGQHKWNSVHGIKSADQSPNNFENCQQQENQQQDHNQDQYKGKDKNKNYDKDARKQRQRIQLQKQIKHKAQQIISQKIVSHSQKNIRQSNNKQPQNQQEQHSFSKFNLEKDNMRQNRSNKSGFFGDFAENYQNNEKQEDNSQFFNQINKTSKQLPQSHKSFTKKNKHFNDYELDSQKQKKFDKQNPQMKPFQTFKNPYQIVQAIQDMKKSIHSSHRSSQTNPFEISKSKINDNPFENSMENNPHNRSFNPNNTNPFISKITKVEDNPFEVSKQNISNPFQQSKQSIGNPFDISKPTIDNPFQTSKRHSQQLQKSKASNPFSQKNSRARQQIPNFDKKRQSVTSNPFDKKSQISQISHHSNLQDHIDKQKHNVSGSSNPFQIKNNSVRNSQIKNQIQFQFNNRNSITSDQQKTSPPIALPNNEPALKKPKSSIQSNLQKYDFNDFINFSHRKSNQNSSLKKSSNNLDKNNQPSFNFSDFPNINNSVQFNQKSQKGQKKQHSDWFEQHSINKPSLQNNQIKNVQDNHKLNQSNTQNKQFNFVTYNENKQFPANNSFQNNHIFNPQKQPHKKPTQQLKNQPFQPFQVKQKLSQIKKQHPSNIQQIEWNKFADFLPQNLVNISKQLSQQNNQNIPTFSSGQLYQVKTSANLISSERLPQKQPHFRYSKQLEILPEQPSSFRKKQIIWTTEATLPYPTQLHSPITISDLSQKKQHLQSLTKLNTQKQLKYIQTNNKLIQYKKKYQNKLSKIYELQKLNQQYIHNYQYLSQINAIKIKQIQQAIKKNKKIQTIQNSILYHQKDLYQKTTTNSSKKTLPILQQSKNKFEKFNQNLRKQQKSPNFKNSLSNFSRLS